MHRLILVSFCFLLTSLQSSNALSAIILNIPLDSDGGGPTPSIIGNVFSATYTNLFDEGVSFSATLTVTGSEAFINHGAGGLGVGPNPGDNTLQDGESVRFTMSISNVLNGTVLFTGFSQVMFNTSNFTFLNDAATISYDNLLGTTGDNFSVAGGTSSALLPANPVAFTVFGGPTPASTDFQLLSVVANFSATSTAVPEPGVSLWAGLVLSLSLAARRRASSLSWTGDSDKSLSK